MPSGMPIIAIAAKISAKEMIIAKFPIVSVVVNFVRSIQKMYPEIIEDKKCRYRYTAPLPTAGLDNFYHILRYVTAPFLSL